MSEQARNAACRNSAQNRSVFWYEHAFKAMPPSLDRMHVKARLDEAHNTWIKNGGIPQELGVDLSVGLARVAEVGQKQAYTRDYE